MKRKRESPPQLHRDVTTHMLSFVDRKSWINIFLTCKLWHEIACKIYDPSIDYDKAIKYACRVGNLDCVKRLLKDDRVSPGHQDNYALIAACEKGYTEIVRELVNHVNPSMLDNLPLRSACESGYHEIVSILLKDDRVDPNSPQFNGSLNVVIRHNRTDCLKELIKHPKFKIICPIFVITETAGRGFTEILRILIQDGGLDPSIDDNRALRIAICKHYDDMVDMLLLDHRVYDTRLNALGKICLLPIAKRIKRVNPEMEG
jgi:ankyrin repeat protein